MRLPRVLDSPIRPIIDALRRAAGLALEPFLMGVITE